MFYTGFRVKLEAIENKHIEAEQNTRLLYLLDGNALIALGDKELSLQSRDILILNPGQSGTVRAQKEGTLCWIAIPDYILDDLLQTSNHVFLLDNSSRQEKIYRELQLLLNQFILEHTQKGGCFDFSQLSLLFEILNVVTGNYLAGSSEPSPDKEMRIPKILGYIHKNYDKPISLSDIAKALYISNVHLSRIFKQYIGMGFREYVNKVRLNHAREELEHTDNSIIRIANDNGFSSVAAFNKLFREEFGEPPSAYRKQIQDQLDKQASESQKHFAENAIPPAEEITRYQKIAEELQQKKNIFLEADTSLAQPYTRPWMDMMNIGTAEDVLNYKIQQHYLQLAGEFKFTYARFWGIFSDSMRLMPRNGNSDLNFSRLDEAISILLKNHLKPFIQFGPKGRDLCGKDGNLFLCEVNSSILTCRADQWEELVGTIIDHFIRVFEKEEVQTWIFEMSSPNPWDGTQQEWFSPEHFSGFYRAVKKRLPKALAGGCEFIEEWHNPRLGEVIQAWKKAGTVPDFLSYMALPYSLIQEPAKTCWLPNADYPHDLAVRAKALMQEQGIENRKLFFTVYNITSSNCNILNDSVYKGAWIIKTAISSINTVDAMCCWLCSDAYAEYFDNQQFLFGGAGLISAAGHRKPAFYAFSFLRKLRSRLVQRNEYSVITTNSQGNYAIVYHNIKKVNMMAFVKTGYEMTYKDLDKFHDDTEPVTLTFSLTHMPESKYYIRIQRINRSSGSIQDEWQRMGGYSTIPTEDIAYFNQISIPRRNMSARSTINGCLTVELIAEPDEFGLIELFPSLD